MDSYTLCYLLALYRIEVLVVILNIIMLITIAALIVLVDWQYNRYNRLLGECKRNHPSGWPTITPLYDWSKDQEGTE